MSTKKIPTKPSLIQQEMLKRHLRIEKSWFEWIFKEGIRLCEQHLIYLDTEGTGNEAKHTPYYAHVYAMDAIRNQGKPDEQKTIYCFFIYHDDQVWKANTSYEVVELIDAIRVGHKWDEYEDKMENDKYELLQKLREEREKKKAAAKTVGKKKDVSKLKKAA